MKSQLIYNIILYIGIVTDLENHLMALATSITNGKLKSNFPYLF